MAEIQIGSVNSNFTNSLKATAAQDGTTDLTTPADYASISALRARLQTIDAAYYTDSMLNSMTVNDMVFAVRSSDDPTTIADYMS